MELNLIDEDALIDTHHLCLSARPDAAQTRWEHVLLNAQNTTVPNAIIIRLVRQARLGGLTPSQCRELAKTYLNHYFGHLPGLACDAQLMQLLSHALNKAMANPK